MNNKGEQLPSFEIPQAAPPEAGEQGQGQAVEAPPAAPETTGKRPQQPVGLPPLLDDVSAVPPPVTVAPPQDLAPPLATDSRAPAGDSDRIEPVWVNRAKNVAARTRDDPHIQSNEMSRIKAEYNLKRFNKQIKTDEAAA
jgi:hypothetical protein